MVGCLRVSSEYSAVAFPARTPEHGAGTRVKDIVCLEKRVQPFFHIKKYYNSQTKTSN
jgi:hypothetical protein